MHYVQTRGFNPQFYNLKFPKGSLEAIPQPASGDAIKMVKDRVILVQKPGLLNKDYIICENQQDIQKLLDKAKHSNFLSRFLFNHDKIKFYSITRKNLYFTKLCRTDFIDINPFRQQPGRYGDIDRLLNYPRTPLQGIKVKKTFGEATQESFWELRTGLLAGLSIIAAPIAMLCTPTFASALLAGSIALIPAAALGLAKMIYDTKPGFQFTDKEIKQFEASTFSAVATQLHANPTPKAVTPLQDAKKKKAPTKAKQQTQTKRKAAPRL